MMSAVGCWVVHARTLSSTMLRWAGSDRSPGVPRRSARPIMVRKSSNICRVLVLKPTQPSALGSIEGNSTDRAGNGIGWGRPSRLHMTSTNRLLQRLMTSVMDTSMWAPGPPRRAWRMAAKAAGAPKTPLAHSVIRPPACTGGPSGRPRCDRHPDSACTVNSVDGRASPEKARPKGVMDNTTSPGISSSPASAAPKPASLITRSAPAMMPVTSGSPRGPTTDRFDPARKRNKAPSCGPRSAPDDDQPRRGSPDGRSILMTSAPASANSLAA